MSMLTLGQASKLCGKSKPTISKAVKDGKLTGQKVGGVFQIEKAELERVYGKTSVKAERARTNLKANGGNTVFALKISTLEEKVADLQNRLDEEREGKAKAEAHEREANARVFAMIEDRRPKSLMQRLLGK